MKIRNGVREMRIVVTGASGRIGREVVRELAAHDYEVVATDRVRATAPLPAGVAFVEADTTDFGAVIGVLTYRGTKPDAVIHLAAIPSPTGHAPEIVFATNVLSTYHIVEAIATLGIPKLIDTSSINWLGMDFAYRPWWPSYLPVDEGHPHQAQDPYALSKYVGEQAAEMLHNRAGTEVISIRPPFVVVVENWPTVVQRVHERPLSFAKTIWSYIDVRDLAVAYRKALETHITGHESFFVVADDAIATVPIAELAPQVDAELGKRAQALTGTQSGVSNAKAKQMLGWLPERSWRDFDHGQNHR